MNAARRKALDALVRDAENLLRLAEHGDWDTLATEERRQRTALEAFFETQPSRDESLDIARALRRLLDIQEQLTAAATRRRNALGFDLRGVRTGRRALRAYAGNAA